jgi:hypothetical protein
MSRFASLRLSRVAILALVLGVTAAILVLLPPPLAAVAGSCVAGQCPSDDIIYYSSPSHQKIVGSCLGCSGICSGMRTAYFLTVPTCCVCDN